MSEREAKRGEALRDEGAQRVLQFEVPFQDEALAFLARWLEWHGDEFIGEDVRMAWEEEGRQSPHHPNAWGAVFLLAAKRNMIERSGGLLKSRDSRAHARLQPAWRKATKRT